MQSISANYLSGTSTQYSRCIHAYYFLSMCNIKTCSSGRIFRMPFPFFGRTANIYIYIRCNLKHTKGDTNLQQMPGANCDSWDPHSVVSCRITIQDSNHNKDSMARAQVHEQAWWHHLRTQLCGTEKLMCSLCNLGTTATYNIALYK